MRRPSTRRAASPLAAALLVWACGTPAPSASPSSAPTPSTSPSVAPTAAGSPDAAIYAQINSQVQAIRGLDERRPVIPKIVLQQELDDVLRTSLDRDYPPARIAGDELLYKGLGLLPRESKLADVFLELLQSQVAGLYDPATESLYVLSKAGGVGPIEKFFYSHEYDHALQDQHYDLETFQKGLEDRSDELLARQALVEGDAYTTMTYWLQANETPEEIGEVLSSANDPAALEALRKIPPIIQTQIAFSATQGTLWVVGQQRAGGWEAIDQAFGDPPASTEQILHPAKWTAREAPIAVELPADLAKKMGSGWTLDHEDTFGEQQIGIWLGGVSQAAAAAGAGAATGSHC